MSEERIAQLEARIEKLQGQLDRATTSVDNATSAFGRLFNLGSSAGNETVGNMTNAFEELNESIGAFTDLGAGMLGFLGSLGSKVPVVGTAANAFFKVLEGGTAIFGGVSDAALKTAKSLANTFDGPSRALRAYDAGIFNLGKQFGSTIEEAERFADGLRQETATEFAQSLYITKDQMTEFMKATERTSLSLDMLNQTVDTGIGSTKLYSVAAAQAAAMNIDVGEAARLFNTAMNRQGKSAQEASEMIAGFSAVSKETGLRAATVAETLNGAVQGFEKLGMSADFGRPILEGFGRTMKDMGLGIENAVGLTQDLSRALAGLTTDYANAYLVFQRGGLDIGGGGGSGVLGASIGMQAAMLEAEKTGDQANIGSQLAAGMRDTLASFTGGDIVTVQDAAESPELQNQFYIQQQMLKTQFNVGDDQSATRILDMLSRLDDATRSGDLDAKAELEKQLKNEMEGRDKTLDEWEKANQQLAIQSNLLAVIARPALEGLRGVAAAGREKVTGMIQSGGAAVQRSMKSAGDVVLETLDDLGFENNNSISQILQAPNPSSSPNISNRGADILAQQAAAGGSLDVDGIVQTVTDLDSSFDSLNLNLNNLPAKIDRVAVHAASQASVSALEQAGFSSRRELSEAIAIALTDAFNAKLNVNIALDPRAAGALIASSAMANDVGQGTRGTAGGTPPSPPE